MSILRLKNINKEFSGKNILNDVSFNIAEGERLGIVGINGAGKTTLADIISGSIRPKSGEVIPIRKNFEIGYLRQSSSYTSHNFNNMLKHDDIQQFNDFLSLASEMDIIGVSDIENNRFNSLSGGEKTKLVLAKIFSKRSDILILDEPTNHLDFNGVDWLSNKIKQFDGTVIIISHDRYFLDQTIERIIEVEDGKVNEYFGNYTYYREQKKQNFESQVRNYQNYQKRQEKLQADIGQLKQWSNKAHRQAGKQGTLSENRQIGLREHHRAKAKKRDKQVKSKINRLQKMQEEGITKPQEEQNVFFKIDTEMKHGKRLVEVNDINIEYGGHTLIHNSSFTLKFGDRVGVLGANGCGKTTLLKLILGHETFTEGEVWISPSAKIAYMSQDVYDLQENMTTKEIIQKYFSHQHTRALNVLSKLGYNQGQINKKIEQLSLGERMRLKIAMLVLQDHNFLILDEPNNHLDLHSREQLEATLAEYPGTLLCVSHDRYMLEKICDYLLVFENGKIKKVLQSINEYLDLKEKSSKVKDKINEGEVLIIENRITTLLSELSSISMDDIRYHELDCEYQELIKKKKDLNSYDSF